MTFVSRQLAGGAAGSALSKMFVPGVGGVSNVDVDTFTTIGAVALDPDDYPGTTEFEAVIEVTDTYTAEVRLYDVTAAAVVAGSTLSTTSDTPVILSASVTLATGARVYEVQLRVTATGGTAVCKQAGVKVSSYVTLAISPAQITATQNDYSPTNWDTATHVRLNTDASQDVTGLDASADMRIKTLINVGSNDLVLKHENVGSTAANRIDVPSDQDLTLQSGDAVDIYYDATTARWRLV